MYEFPPNIDPKIQTLISTLVGMALIDDFNAREQLAIGNGLVLMGQTMITNGNFQLLIEQRMMGDAININSRQFKKGGSATKSKRNYRNIYKHVEIDEQLDLVKQAIEKISEEIDKIKKDML